MTFHKLISADSYGLADMIKSHNGLPIIFSQS
jgi:hypothetical protein